MNSEVYKKEVDMRLADSISFYDSDKHGNIPIIYEDNHLLLAIKPAGILSQADASRRPDMLTLLKQYIRDKYNKPGDVFLGLVHRLDCPVEGLMVFGRTSKAASRLSEQIRQRSLEKKYYAVVERRPPADQGVLSDTLLKGVNNRVMISDRGKQASLEYRLIEYNEHADISLLSITLHTGRTHQIRLQLSHMGNPILGDDKYRLNDSYAHTDIEGKGSLQRISLYSYFLGFHHPTKPIRLEIKIIPPDCLPWSIFEWLHH